MKVRWERAIRFIAADGRILRGEPILPSPEFDLGQTTPASGLKAKVIVGDDLYDTTGATTVSNEVVSVATLLGPLSREDVPILRCVGLNYAKHSMVPLVRPLQAHTEVTEFSLQSRRPAEVRHHSRSFSSSQIPQFTTMMFL